MNRDRMRRSLERLNIPVSDVRVLKLLPLVYVAWADGKMERVEKERINNFAASQFDLSQAGAAVLSWWLSTPPTHQYIAEGLHDIFLLARAVDEPAIDFSELPGIISYAEGIARSTARALDQPTAVSPPEERALEEIARELHVDHGESWAKLLQELA